MTLLRSARGSLRSVRGSKRTAKLAATAVVVASAMVLSSCGAWESFDASMREKIADDPAQAAQSEEVVTVTSTVTPGAPEQSQKSTITVTETAGQDEPEGAESEGDASSSKSAEDAGSVAISKANEISSPGAGDRWTVVDSNFDSDSDLSYVAMRMEQSPRVGMLVALFHKGNFVQFASNDVGDVAYAKGTSDGVEVGFIDGQAFRESGDMLGNLESYNQPVTFYWDGSGVSHRGEIPER